MLESLELSLQAQINRDADSSVSTRRKQLSDTLQQATKEELADPKILSLILKVLIEQCELDETEIIAWFGVGRNTLRRWASGETVLHPLVASIIADSLKNRLKRRILN